MKIIDALKKTKKIIVYDGFTRKKVKYTNVHITMGRLYGDNINYKSCLLATLWKIYAADKEYNSKNGIWIGEEKYMFCMF